MERRRARAYGLSIGRLPTGELNAITDVAGVRVGHKTVVRDPSPDLRGAARTGVTAIFPHADLPWVERVYAGTHVLNGYGELIGINQINEWGVLHSPIVLTSSLAIGKAYDATVRWRQDRHAVTTWDGGDMPVVTECDDSFLNDVTTFPLADEDVFDALDGASAGPVPEGAIGAGTGMVCCDFKGGIGTASRVLDEEHGSYAVGALVMTNWGIRSDLLIDGVPVGREITDLMPGGHGEGSAIVVLATDAPMLPHQLRRLAQRGGLGLARAGSTGRNGSGEIIVAFSTANRLPHDPPDPVQPVRALVDGPGEDTPSVLSALFEAGIEAVEESVINSMFLAETIRGRDGNVVHALPIDRTLEILERHGRLAR